jgi:hypothetical protein
VLSLGLTQSDAKHCHHDECWFWDGGDDSEEE